MLKQNRDVIQYSRSYPNCVALMKTIALI